MAQLTIQQLFELAFQHHKAGQLREAEQVYRQILAQQPEQAGALHYLGLIAHQLGRSDAAVELIRRAVAFKPDYVDAHINLGIVLKDKGQHDEAIAAYRAAIALKPNHAEAYNNLGNALEGKGQLDEAVASYRQAIAFKPNYAEAHNNLGNVRQDQGQLDEAIAVYRQAIALNPKLASAHNNLGNALRKKGQLDEAIAAYRQAIALKPNFAEAYYNLGTALRNKRLREEAIAACRQAIALKPNYAEGHNGLGIALATTGRLDEAVAAYRRAIALDPQSPNAFNNLGISLRDRGELDEALAAFRQALQLKPDSAEAHSNLVYNLHFHSGYDAKMICAEHRRWNRQLAEPLGKFILPHTNSRDPDRRLRIGYMSPDFANHPVGRFLFPLFSEHDADRFEMFCYSDVVRGDEMTELLRQRAAQWRNALGLADEALAQLIREDQIDILVDLSMHTSHNRLLLFARKPAPVQVTYLAYCSTTGLDTMDYRLTDPYLDPPGMDDSVYSEQSIRLPHTFWCYPRDDQGPEVTPLPATSAGDVTFGCLNSFCKVSPEALDVWLQLLRAAPRSQLILHADEGNHRQRAWDLLESQGLDRRRLSFVGKVGRFQYFKEYQQIDIGLDPFPCNGGTTTCDALWMGVPVVTLRGRTAVGRAGVSILSNVGLTDWIADNPEQYVSIAQQMAGDLPRLGELRSTLRRRMRQSPLMDAPQFARDVEAAYRQMWHTWCETGTATRQGERP